jgi:hypothetical protein
MGECSRSDENEFVEDVRKQCSVMDFEEDARLAHKSWDFSQYESGLFDKKRVKHGMNQFGVQMRRVLFQEDVVLNAEMWREIGKIDIFWEDVHADNLCVAENSETLKHVFLVDGKIDVFHDILSVRERLEQAHDVL